MTGSKKTRSQTANGNASAKSQCKTNGAKSKTKQSSVLRRALRCGLEQLESREYFAVDPLMVYRSFDGTGNNISNPTWGAAGTDLLRLVPAAYADGISSPAGANRPSSRVISNTLSDHPDDDIKSDRALSNMVYAWGQFIDHDIDLTGSDPTKTKFNVAVPKGDPEFDPNGTGTQVISLTRSQFDIWTGTSKSNPRQQVNSITSFLDGSMIYGSDLARANALRTFSGGLLKTSNGALLPLNSEGLANANDTHRLPDNVLFLAGDVRANENIELTSLQTLFVREHNRLAKIFATKNPSWSDEALYQQARRLVIGELQAITYNEFLPALLGTSALKPYAGYNPKVNPAIGNEFSTAAFRFGHSMLGNDVEFFDNNGNPVREALELKEALFNPEPVYQQNIDSILKYLTADRAEEVDLKVVDSLRNFLFGEPGQGGLDLVSLNIQRGRDHGLADYNSVRAAYGLPKVTSFEQITPDKAVQAQLKQLYGNVNNIDLWVGGLAEKHLPGSSMGPTFTRIIAEQFQRLRDGDRFWYQRDLKGWDLSFVSGTTLSNVIRWNTGITNLQDNVFFFYTSVAGRVMVNVGNSYVPAVGRTVQLIDDTGTIIQSVKTDKLGYYKFEHLATGNYTIKELPASGYSSSNARAVSITRGMSILAQDFTETFKKIISKS